MAVRQLRARPVLSAVAVTCLTFGIGANTLLFSAVDALLLRPLPVPEPDRLVRVFDPEARTSLRSSFAADELERMDRESATMDGVLGAAGFRAAVELPGGSELVRGELVTTNFFDVMGVPPRRGRGFAAGEREPGAGQVVVVGHALSERITAAGVDPLGSELKVNGRTLTVIGIAPADFPGTRFLAPADLWVPTGARAVAGVAGGLERFEALGRMRPGVDHDAAAAELDAVLRRGLAGGEPPRAEGGVFVLPERAGLINPARPGLVRAGAAAALGVSLLMLLIACGNVGGLVLVRAEERAGEMGVRTALGAGRGRLLAQLLLEAAVLVTPALAAGLWIAFAAEPFFAWLLPVLADRPLPFTVDGRLLVYSVGLGLLTVLLCALAPALRVLRAPAHLLGRRGDIGRSGGRLLGTVVTAQVAVATVVLVASGYFTRTLLFYESVDPGYDVEDRLAIAVDAAVAGTEPAAAPSLFARIAQAAADVPGVTGVTLASGVTVGPERLEILGAGAATPLRVSTNDVQGGYFDLLGVSLVAGDASPLGGEAPDPGAVVINETLADLLWPGAGAAGRTIRTTGGAELRVVAVAPTLRHGALAAPARPLLYRPFGARPILGPTLLVSFDGEIETVVAALRVRLAAVAPEVPVVSVRTLEAFVDEDRLLARAAARLAIGAGLVCLVLSVAGLFGALSYTVRRRRAEIGIRIALGDTPAGILRRMLGGAGGLAGLGMALGVPLGLVLVQLLSGLLPGTRAMDPLVVGSVLALMALACGAAVAVPGRRAARMDPAAALRRD